MWIFTKHGMISAVEHRDDQRLLVVRARVKAHLMALGAEAKIEHTPNGDYEFRIVVSKFEFSNLMLDQIEEIDYDNFKGACDAGKDRPYARSLHRIWQVVYDALATNTGRARVHKKTKPAKAEKSIDSYWNGGAPGGEGENLLDYYARTGSIDG